MIIIGLALSLFVVGFLCWLLFTLAVYAMPFFVGVTAAFAAFNHGAGVIGALVVGLIASVVTLVVSQAAFAVAEITSCSLRDRPPLCGAQRPSRGFTRRSDSRRSVSPQKSGAIFSRSWAPLSSAARLSFVWRARRTRSRMSGALLSSLPSRHHRRWRPRAQGIDVGHLHLLVG